MPVIGLYYILNIFLLAVWLGATVCVLNFHFRGHKVSSVPRWLKIVLLIKTESVEDDDIHLSQLKIQEHVNHSQAKVAQTHRRDSLKSQSNNLTNLDKILKIMKVYIQKLDKNSLKSKKIEKIAIEWKEVARRIDMILCVLVTITVTSLPIYLFGKFMGNYHIAALASNRQCGCQ